MSGARGKGLRMALRLFLAFALAGLAAAAALILFVWAKETHLPPEGEYDAVIVLGAQVKADGTASVALERRLTVALAAYEERPCAVIACGGRGGDEPVAEGDFMRDWLVARGVAETDAVAEATSFDTRENLEHAKAAMAERGLSRALVVTSDYHVPRALALCRQLGIEATGRGSPSKPEYFVKNHLREGLSWIKFALESVL